MTAAVRSRGGRARSREPFATPDLDVAIEAAEAAAVVIWRGARLPYRSLQARIAHTPPRAERFGMFTGYLDAVEAINPLREARLEQLAASAREAGHVDLVAAAMALAGYEPQALMGGMQRFLDETETVYFAALRRYLALIDIEQGDGTLADLWHILEGSGWNLWFDDRRVSAALRATTTGLSWDAPPEIDTSAEVSPWSAARARLRGIAGGVGPASAISQPAAAGEAALLASLLMEPEWLAGELGMTQGDVVSFADFAAFARLWRLRRDSALLAYELRLYRTPDTDQRRAYYAGIVGLMTGIANPEPLYLAAVDRPWAAGANLRAEMLAAMAQDALRVRHGKAWWRAPAAGAEVRQMAAAHSIEDAVAPLGYDHVDWRPVLRQIRTQLIGEMSGYGGPNITTRAGTRKV